VSATAALPAPSEPHLIHTLATMLEALATECFNTDELNSAFDGFAPSPDPGACRDTARELLDRLRAAGFDVVKRLG
jgi:hypothetical protein